MIESILDSVAESQGVSRETLSHKTYNGANFVTVTVYRSNEPYVVCRFARYSKRDLTREYGNLRRVSSLVTYDPRIRESTERVITVQEVGGKPVLLTTVLPGIKAGNLLVHSGAMLGNFLESSTQWLVDLIDVSEECHVYDRSMKRNRLATMTETGGGQAMTAFVDDDDLFLGPMHGDFAPSNLLLGSDRRLSGVIDFEWFDVHGVPLFDFLHLVVTTGATMFDTPSTIVERTLFEDNTLTRTVTKCARRFRQRIGISASTFRRILPLYSAIRFGWGHEPPPFQRAIRTALHERTDEIRWTDCSS